MPFADALADAAVSQATGPAALVISGIVLAVFAAERLSKARRTWRTDGAEATTAEAAAKAAAVAADDKASEQWKLLYADVKTDLLRSQQSDRECQEGRRQQQAEIDALKRETHGLKHQNAGQQKQLDTLKTVVGIPPGDGSAPHPALPPAPDSPPKG